MQLKKDLSFFDGDFWRWVRPSALSLIWVRDHAIYTHNHKSLEVSRRGHELREGGLFILNTGRGDLGASPIRH